MVYIKRSVSIVLVFLLFASVALAAHTSSASLENYDPIYETTSTNVSVEVTNSFFSSDSINVVEFLLAGFDVSKIFDVGWSSTLNGSLATFSTSKDMIGRWGSQNFGFEISAGNVDEDQSVEWTVTSYDENGDSHVNTLELLILNDGSAPEISNVLPQNGSFVKEGTTAQTFSLTAVDNETGVKSVDGDYGLCSNLSNSLDFQNSGDDYAVEEDVSNYVDEDVICYKYVAESNGGELAIVDGHFTIDGSAPTVNLVSPENGDIMNNNSLFEFTATDNLAPTLNCFLYVDDDQRDSAVVDNGDNAQISVDNIPEGNHEWYVSCVDLADNEGDSETRTFILDKTAPLINVTSPISGTVNKAGIPVEVEVTDENGVAVIQYEFQNNTYTNITSPFSVNTDSAVDGENHIIIYAIDNAGNEAVLDYVMIVDKEGPSVDLVSPSDNNTYDVHVPFILIADDNYDDLLNCSVIAEGDNVGTIMAEDGALTQQEVLIAPGNYTVVVECYDDADNMGQSNATKIEVRDLSPPDIFIDDIATIVRGETAQFRATITDFSGVDSVSAILILSDNSTETISLDADGDVYTAEYPTTLSSPLGTYTLTITAEDGNGNVEDESADFEVINSYLITVDVTSPVYTGKEVIVTGTAQRDDGGAVDEVTLVLPSQTSDVEVVNGTFSYTFSAPSTVGTYDITAYIEINNKTFDDVASLQVRAQSSKSKSSSSSSHHSTVVMPDPFSGNAEPECTKDSDCLEGYECHDGECIAVPEEIVEEKLEPKPADPGEDPHAAINVSEQPGNGIGRASGFLNLDKIKWTSLLWIILAVVAIGLVIKMLSGDKGKKRGKTNTTFDLDKYLANRKR